MSTFNQLRKAVSLYLRFTENDELSQEKLRISINEAILEFLEIGEWQFTQVEKTFTRDGSKEYLLSSIITAGADPAFSRALELIQESTSSTSGDTFLERVERRPYLKRSTKSGLWSMDATKLYVLGDSGDLILMYESAGVIPEFVKGAGNDDQTNLILTHYSHIIKNWAVYKALIEFNDESSAQIENQELNKKLTKLKKKENRNKKSGAEFKASAHNR